jgi:hypothetical protein
MDMLFNPFSNACGSFIHPILPNLRKSSSFHSRYLAHVFAETGNIFRKLVLRPDLSQDREYRVPVVRLYPAEKPLVFNF